MEYDILCDYEKCKNKNICHRYILACGKSWISTFISDPLASCVENDYYLFVDNISDIKNSRIIRAKDKFFTLDDLHNL